MRQQDSAALNRRIALVGDEMGIPQLLEVVPPSSVVCIVGASIRPRSLGVLSSLAKKRKVPFLVQPKYQQKGYQPFCQEFLSCAPDLLICNSYSMLVRDELIEAVDGRAYNVHWSLLPRHRGPNPVQWALIKGDRKTGVTIHIMDRDFDTGAVVGQSVERIREDDTWITLASRLKRAALQLMQELVPLLLRGNINSTTFQDPATGSRNTRLTPDSPLIDLERMSDWDVYNLIRAQVAPLGGAYVETTEGRAYFKERVPLREIPMLRQRYHKKALLNISDC